MEVGVGGVSSRRPVNFSTDSMHVFVLQELSILVSALDAGTVHVCSCALQLLYLSALSPALADIQLHAVQLPNVNVSSSTRDVAPHSACVQVVASGHLVSAHTSVIHILSKTFSIFFGGIYLEFFLWCTPLQIQLAIALSCHGASKLLI